MDGTRVLPEDLHADGPLARDHVWVVVGMHERQISPPLQLLRVAVRFVVGIADQQHFRAARRDRIDLDPRRGHGHHDLRPAPQALRRERDPLRMVAGGSRDHPALQRRARERGHLVVGAAELEGEDGLHVLPLEEDLVSGAQREPGGAIERRLDGDVVDARGEDPLQVVPRSRRHQGTVAKTRGG
jgi:hypothetical protein